jgi:hypothetical protein
MKFWDNKGNIAVMAALTMPMVIGGAGLGVETGYWYYEQLHLQQAADAAAYAAALEQRAGAEDDDTLASAQAAAGTNGFDEDTDEIAVVTPSAVADEENSVDVELTRTLPRAFTALFGDDPIVIRAKATAAYSTAANACVLALDKSAAPAVSFSGNSSAEMAGCVIMSNSLAANAVNFDGNSSVTAPCIMAVGGSVQGSNADVELTQCAAVQTGQPPAADPFRDMPYPTASGCVAQVGDGLTPGCYTGAALKNTVNLTSGVYVINGGTFKINANAVVSGSNVTIVLLNGATVDINGTANVNLSAPTTGTYKGMLFMGSRTSGAGGISTFNGTASSHLTGALYFPKQQIVYKGNFSGNGGCTQIVGATVMWSGNTHFNVDCTDYGLEPITAGSAVRLVA